MVFRTANANRSSLVRLGASVPMQKWTCSSLRSSLWVLNAGAGGVTGLRSQPLGLMRSNRRRRWGSTRRRSKLPAIATTMRSGANSRFWNWRMSSRVKRLMFSGGPRIGRPMGLSA